jgi:DNA-binding SARP family transcriptional activator
MLRLRTFGGLWIKPDSSPATGAASQRRPLALLALLAVAGGGGLSRDTLRLFLWPESDQERGRNSLRQTLHTLRRDLGAPTLFLGSATVRLNPAAISSDVCDFTDALSAGRLCQAADLYQGEFLDGFHITGAPDFEHWVDEQRWRYAREAGDVLRRLASQALGAGDAPAAVPYLRRLATMDPLDPVAAAALIRAVLETGDLASALEHAEAHAAAVMRDLGMEIDPTLGALVARIRAGHFGSPARRSTPQRAVDPPPDPDAVRPVPVVAPPGSPPVPQPGAPDSPGGRAAGVAAILLILVGLGIAILREQRVPLSPDRVAIAPFQVLDSSLGMWHEGLSDVLSRNLDRAGPLRTVPPRIIAQRWRGPVDAKAATDLGRGTGARFVILGTIQSAGPDSVRVAAMAVDASTGKTLREVERRQAVTRMGRLTDSLTVAILDILRLHVPIGTFESGSLGAVGSFEAVKDFLVGEQFFRRSIWDSASVYYLRAIDKDSGFALALHHLGNAVAWQHRATDSLAILHLLRAGALNHGLGARDSLLIESDSLAAAANLAENEMLSWRLGRRLFQTLAVTVERYPDDAEAWFALGEAQYHFGGGPIMGVPDSTALKSFDRAIALDSAFAPAYLHAIELGLDIGGTALSLRYLREYLRNTPPRHAHGGAGLVGWLLDRRSTDTATVREVLDTIDLEVLVSARTILRRWPDSEETAIRLSRTIIAREANASPPARDTALMSQRLAEELAFRGHLHEAAAVANNRDLRIVAELALMGAVPADSANAVFLRWLRHGSPHRELALTWWSSRANTAAIKEFLRQSTRDLDTVRTDDQRLVLSYVTAAAKAHLALAAGDTLKALGRFIALPDTLCPTCYLDRFTRARLLEATGRLRAAMRDLIEPLHAFLTPMEVSYALERARLARRLGEMKQWRQDSDFVDRAWHNADPNLRRWMAENKAER